MPASSVPPRIALIGTGGTMSSVSPSPLDLMNYPTLGHKLTLDEILARVPEAAAIATIEPVPFRSVDSTALTPADWFGLRATIRRLAREAPDLAGFVVIHGTATLEETAFFLNLTLDIPQTVVVVGAQRPISAISSDAPLNLINALRVAGDPAARGRGVLVVLNDEIHPARDVVKTATLRLQTFRSADFGALGVADADGVRFYRRADRPHAPDTAFAGLPDTIELPRVDILYSYAGADSVALEAFLRAGARGIVSAGLAPGSLAAGERAALEAAARAGIAVVQCSRAPSGRVIGRLSIHKAGFIQGEDFSPQKARILLALALLQTSDTARLREIFATY